MKPQNHKINPEVLIGVFIGILVLYVGIAFALDRFKEAEFIGKYSGTLESIFSSLAFAGLFITILLQNESISKQSNAIQQQQTALDQQKMAIQIQEDSLVYQKKQYEINLEAQEKVNQESIRRNFAISVQIHESAYNRLSNRSKEILEKTDFIYRGGKLQSEDYFRSLVGDIKTEYIRLNTRNQIVNSNKQENKEELKNVIQTQFNKYGKQAVSYIKSLVLNTEILLINKDALGKLYTLYNADLRFSIGEYAAKYLCIIYIYIDKDIPDLTNIVDELFLFAAFNNDKSPVDEFFQSEVIEKLKYKKEVRKDV